MKPDEQPQALPETSLVVKSTEKKKRKNRSRELKREMFARAYVANGGNGTKAVLSLPAARNGRKKANSAATIASLLLNEEKTIALIHKYASQYQCGPEEQFASLGTALLANQLVRNPDGSILTEYPDWQARLKAVDIGTKLLRLQPRTGSRADAVAGRAQVHLHLPAEQGPDALEGVADRLRDRQAKRAERKAKRQAIDVQVIDSNSEPK